MRIGMILERDFPTTPPDIRVEKECQSLIRAGHEVFLLSLKISPRPDREIVDRVHIVRVPVAMHNIRDWSARSVERHFHSHESPWIEAMNDFVSENALQALHVHDLPLAWCTTVAAAQNRIPAVFDMHEVYPPMVRFMRPLRAGAWDPAAWVEKYERECLDRADRIIVTVAESKERLLSMGIPKEKAFVVMNAEKTGNMRSARPGPAGSGGNGLEKPGLEHQESSLASRLVVSYVGAFGEVRGLEYLIHALKKVETELPHMHLLLVGGGYNQPQLEALAKDLGLEDQVTITGWVHFKEVPRFIGLSHICVVPHVKNAFTDTTVPHKLFQYMLMGKPVVVSDADPLERIVRECDCGRVFPSGDVEALAAALKDLASDPRERDRLGKNGLAMALGKYNWRRAEENLLELYAGLPFAAFPERPVSDLDAAVNAVP